MIFINKQQKNKEHFSTWHGTYGLLACIALLTQLTVGVFAKYPRTLLRFISYSSIRRAHSIGGIFTYSAGCTALVLGLFSTWFVKEAGYVSVVMLLMVKAVIAALVGVQVFLSLINKWKF